LPISNSQENRAILARLDEDARIFKTLSRARAIHLSTTIEQINSQDVILRLNTLGLYTPIAIHTNSTPTIPTTTSPATTIPNDPRRGTNLTAPSLLPANPPTPPSHVLNIPRFAMATTHLLPASKLLPPSTTIHAPPEPPPLLLDLSIQ
jgi:hypothetical protein